MISFPFHFPGLESHGILKAKKRANPAQCYEKLSIISRNKMLRFNVSQLTHLLMDDTENVIDATPHKATLQMLF